MSLKRFSKILKSVATSPMQLVKDMKSADSTSDKRAALRRHHARTVHPFQSNTKDIRNAQEKIDSGDPAQQAEGYAIMERADKRTKDQGTAGLAVLGATIFNSVASGGSPDAAGAAGDAASASADTSVFGNVNWTESATSGVDYLNKAQAAAAAGRKSEQSRPNSPEYFAASGKNEGYTSGEQMSKKSLTIVIAIVSIIVVALLAAKMRR